MNDLEKILETKLYKHFADIYDKKGYVQLLPTLFTEDSLAKLRFTETDIKASKALVNSDLKEKTYTQLSNLIQTAIKKQKKAEKLNGKDCIFFNKDRVMLIKISSLREFFEVFDGKGNKGKKIYEDLKTTRIFYRGQCDINFKPEPGIFRDKNFIKKEKDIFREMIKKNPSEFYEDSSDFEKLARMQHYGAPTRLLDLTENPCVALYFACEGKSKSVGEIILYAPEDEYEKFFDSKEIKEFNLDNINNECFFVHAKFNNKRIASQAGLFLMFGNKTENNEFFASSPDKCYKKTKDGRQLVLYIPNDKKKSILNSLEIINIRKKSLYLELNDVAADIKETYKSK